MGMVVRSNIMAMNAQRQLGMNNSQVAKSLEKLSSGFKINRAGDDASGLAISEKMKAQIKGLETASANAQDGISLVQTAEGALTEVHDMLNRMVELAEKAANGTLENPDNADYNSMDSSIAGTDRAALQEEMDALATEIDRIADSTNFNKIDLLNGKLGGVVNVQATKGTEEVAAVKQRYEFDFTGKSALTTGDKVVIAGQTLTMGSGISATSLGGQLNEIAAHLNSNVTGYTATVSGNKIILEASNFGAVGSVGGPASTVALNVTWGANDGVAGTVATTNFSTTVTVGAAGGSTAHVLELDLAGSTFARNVGFTLGGARFTIGSGAGTSATAVATSFAASMAGKVVTFGGVTYTVQADGEKLIFTSSKKGTSAGTAPATIAITTASTIKFKGNAVTAKQTAAMTSKAEFTFDLTGVTNGATAGIMTITVGGSAITVAITGGATAGAIATALDSKDLVINSVTYTITKDGNKLKFTSKENLNTAIASPTVNRASFSIKHGMDAGDTLNGSVAATGAATVPPTGGYAEIEMDRVPRAKSTVTVDGKTFEFIKSGESVSASGNIAITLTTNMTATQALAALKDAVGNSFTSSLTATISGNTLKITSPTTIATAPAVGQTGGGLVLQIGDTNDSFNKLTVTVDDMHMKSLFESDPSRLISSNGASAKMVTTASGARALNISTQENASAAVDAIKTVVNVVSTQRAKLGAIQNRLEHTINNLDVAAENMSAANSRIRDTDMAKQMMDYTKMNVLTQAAQAMLAQANQQPQSVLQLLQ